MKKSISRIAIAATLLAPMAAYSGSQTVNGSAAADASSTSSAVFQALSGGDAQALFTLAQSLFGASADPNTGAITTPVVFIEGVGDATITITPDGNVTVTPVRRGSGG